MNSQNNHFWVGMTDERSEGTWMFTNGKPATDVIFGWRRGEPNNYDNQDCEYFNINRGLDDSYCHKSGAYARRALCQIPNGRC